MTPRPNVTIKYEYTPEAIKDLIVSSLLEQHKGSEFKLDFTLRIQLEGYGMAEHPVTEFLGATVTVTPKKP